MKKSCDKCNIEKYIEEFYYREDQGRYLNRCIKCIRIEQKIYSQQNKKQISQKDKRNYEKNKIKIAARSKAYNITHKEEINNIKNKYEKNKRLTNIDYRLRKNISSLIYFYLKLNNSSKNKSILNYINIQEIKNYLEVQFVHKNNLIDGKVWMSWKNWGVYNPKKWNEINPDTWTWQLDHIMPQSKLPFTSMEDINFKICWHKLNLRPLITLKNIQDGARNIDYELLTSIIKNIEDTQNITINIKNIIEKIKI